ncbi:MAG TPA: acetate--CoA ligase [Candidatus Dormibacteraeota bacterium]|nr:acetate--CoA ligase [Candidatus Dormibacteraeota bacterium]
MQHVESYIPYVAPDADALRAAFERDRAAAEADPLAFWAEQAKTLAWQTPFTRVLDDSRAPFFRWFGDGKLNIVASAIDRHAAGALRNKTAFVWLSEDGRTRIALTYGELAVRVGRAANALRAMGVRKGDAVVIYMPLTLEAVEAMLACARLGAVHSVVYAGLAATSLQARIEDARAVAVVTADFTYRRGKPIALAPIVEQALATGCNTVREVGIWRRSHDSEIRDVRDGRERHDWHRLLQGSSPEAPLEIVGAEHPLFILYTSGTTGKPKGVLHVHGGYAVGTSYLMRAMWRVGPDEVFWCTSDIGWIVGHSYIVYAPLIAGITTLFREGAPDFPRTDIFYDIVERERVNVIFTAPTMIRFLMKYGDEPARKRNLRSLRWITSAGEPLNPEAFLWARRVLCGEGAWGNLAEQWWQTETGGPNIGTPPGVPAKLGAAGLPLAGIATEIVGQDLYLKRPFPHLFRTVYGDDERFRAAWDEHGYRTGDAAVQDPDGYIRVIGRVDDVMKVAGHRIGSAEIEHALVQHPLVAEAAAFGVPDELKGERIVCHVTLRAGAEAPSDPTAFFGEHVRETMGPVAAPSEVLVVASLPKTRSGKIMRRLLRARAMGAPEGDTSTLDA